MSFLTKRLRFTSELRYLNLVDSKNSQLVEQEPQGTFSGPRRRSPARLGGLSDVDQLNDLMQRHEMDTANAPNVEEAETKGKTAQKLQKLATQRRKKFTLSPLGDANSPSKRARRQGVVTRPKFACLGEREAAALPRDEHRTLRTNAHPCAYSSNAKILVDVHPNGGAKILHVYYDNLSPNEMESTTDEFFRILFAEKSSKFANLRNGRGSQRFDSRSRTHILFSQRPRRSQRPRSKYDVENARRIETHARVRGGRQGNVRSGGVLNEFRFSLIGESERRDGRLFS